MKIITTSLIAISLLVFSNITIAGDLTAEREARTLRIEALSREVSALRKSRSSTIESKLQLARAQAEMRKELRQLDRIRDREVALKQRG